MSPDLGAKAAAVRPRIIVDRFFNGVGCISALRRRGNGGLATRSKTNGISYKDCEGGK